MSSASEVSFVDPPLESVLSGILIAALRAGPLLQARCNVLTTKIFKHICYCKVFWQNNPTISATEDLFIKNLTATATCTCHLFCIRERVANL